MNMPICDAIRELARVLALCRDYPNHPNRPKWLDKAITYAGTIANALESDERTIKI